MKRLTTILLSVLFMVSGISLALYQSEFSDYKKAMAQSPPTYYYDGDVPLDVQLDLEKRLSKNLSPPKDSIRIIDSINIVDSVRWKTKWKIRYKDVANRTKQRELGLHPEPVAPDCLAGQPNKSSTLGREEKPNEGAGASKVPAIQLSVDGKIVYSSKNDNHSAEEGQ